MVEPDIGTPRKWCVLHIHVYPEQIEPVPYELSTFFCLSTFTCLHSSIAIAKGKTEVRTRYLIPSLSDSHLWSRGQCGVFIWELAGKVTTILREERLHPPRSEFIHYRETHRAPMRRLAAQRK